MNTLYYANLIAWFTLAMAGKLSDNSHKGGWRGCTRRYLLRRLGQEKAELERAIKRGATKAEVIAEAADVANFAMMLADTYEEPVEKTKRVKSAP